MLFYLTFTEEIFNGKLNFLCRKNSAVPSLSRTYHSKLRVSSKIWLDFWPFSSNGVMERYRSSSDFPIIHGVHCCRFHCVTETEMGERRDIFFYHIFLHIQQSSLPFYHPFTTYFDLFTNYFCLFQLFMLTHI